MSDTPQDAAVIPEVQDMPQVYVEWDEPGAGAIVLDGERVIDFNVHTDWSDAWNPKVQPDALEFLDRLPRWAQEVTHAYWCAKEYQKQASLAASSHLAGPS